MANRDPKNVKRFIENISKEAAKIVYEGGGSGGGTIVVDELPEVGEEHTIYELQETSKEVYGWVFCYGRIPDPNYNQFLVFDTYEQMVSTINSVPINENTKDIDYYAYIRNTNQMYYFCVEYPEEPEEPYWIFEEQQKKEDPSGTNYAFQLETLADYQTFYILKEFVGNIIPIPDGGWQVSYLTLDNKEVYLGYEGFGVLLRNIVYPNKLDYGVNDFIGTLPEAVLDHLPTSTEAEELFYNQLKCNKGDIILYNTSDDKYYYISNEDVDYFWYVTNYQTLDGYFAQDVEVEADTPPHYNGPLVWEEDTGPVGLPIFNEIPYEQIINNGEGQILDWRFIPKQAGEVTSTYWIYTNDEWVNIDDITSKEDFPIAYGELTKSDTFEQNQKLDCSLTIDEICSYLDENKLVVLSFIDNEINYCMAIYDWEITETGPNLVCATGLNVLHQSLAVSICFDYLEQYFYLEYGQE